VPLVVNAFKSPNPVPKPNYAFLEERITLYSLQSK
jgi:hypothetical protein